MKLIKTRAKEYGALLLVFKNKQNPPTTVKLVWKYKSHSEIRLISDRRYAELHCRFELFLWWNHLWHSPQRTRLKGTDFPCAVFLLDCSSFHQGHSVWCPPFTDWESPCLLDLMLHSAKYEEVEMIFHSEISVFNCKLLPSRDNWAHPLNICRCIYLQIVYMYNYTNKLYIYITYIVGFKKLKYATITSHSFWHYINGLFWAVPGVNAPTSFHLMHHWSRLSK